MPNKNSSVSEILHEIETPQQKQNILDLLDKSNTKVAFEQEAQGVIAMNQYVEKKNAEDILQPEIAEEDNIDLQKAESLFGFFKGKSSKRKQRTSLLERLLGATSKTEGRSFTNKKPKFLKPRKKGANGWDDEETQTITYEKPTDKSSAKAAFLSSPKNSHLKNRLKNFFDKLLRNPLTRGAVLSVAWKIVVENSSQGMISKQAADYRNIRDAFNEFEENEETQTAPCEEEEEINSATFFNKEDENNFEKNEKLRFDESTKKVLSLTPDLTD